MRSLPGSARRQTLQNPLPWFSCRLPRRGVPRLAPVRLGGVQKRREGTGTQARIWPPRCRSPPRDHLEQRLRRWFSGASHGGHSGRRLLERSVGRPTCGTAGDTTGRCVGRKALPEAQVTNWNSTPWPRNGWGASISRCTPTENMTSSGAWKACSTKPAVPNQCRSRGVRSGCRLLRVQITVAPEAQSSGRAATVRWTSASLRFPKTPASSTRSAGAAPKYASEVQRRHRQPQHGLAEQRWLFHERRQRCRRRAR